MAEPGKVYLVGAGPGDPDLITVKGLTLLRQADVIIYDRLAPPELLTEARADAELIDGGKQPTKHRLNQDEINRIMIDRAQQGAMVVRLKGGDPFVFGRGGEEALACHAAGIAFEIVPGVSSAFAVPAYAGIPLTHRQLARSFSVFTGHEDPAAPETTLDYAALAQQDTLVAMMGVKQLAKIATRLIEHGKNPDTPAACIEWGTIARQRVVEGTLATLPALVAQANIQPPAIMVVGEVVRLRNQGLDWFKP
ncbi:MAG: uroporphyrinogen-III C-methyltransferase [Anaerolineae bacterium]|nr:uroporphyrinogen-III C-methyltransferase [Anaerolineae bacterium]